LARLTRRLLGQRHLPRQPRLQRQVLSFAAVGALTTAVHVVLFLALRQVVPALAANALALAAATPVNTGLNRMLTFGVHGSRRLARDHAEAGALFLVGLAATSVALLAFDAVWPGHPALVGVAAVLLANGTITLLRFLLLRAWVFHPGRR